MTHPPTEHCGSADGPACVEAAFAPAQWVAFAPYVSGSR